MKSLQYLLFVLVFLFSSLRPLFPQDSAINQACRGVGKGNNCVPDLERKDSEGSSGGGFYPRRSSDDYHHDPEKRRFEELQKVLPELEKKILKGEDLSFNWRSSDGGASFSLDKEGNIIWQWTNGSIMVNGFPQSLYYYIGEFIRQTKAKKAELNKTHNNSYPSIVSLPKTSPRFNPYSVDLFSPKPNKKTNKKPRKKNPEPIFPGIIEYNKLISNTHNKLSQRFDGAQPKKQEVPEGHVAVNVSGGSLGTRPPERKVVPQDILPRLPSGQKPEASSAYGFRTQPGLDLTRTVGDCLRDPASCSSYQMYKKGSQTQEESVDVIELKGEPQGLFQFHGGIDLKFPKGTPVVPPRGGKVHVAKEDPEGFGYYIIIDHGGGHYTLYAHLKYLPSLKKGDFVEAGETIGSSGQSGKARGPHLHFEHLYVLKSVREQPGGLLDRILAPVRGIFAPIIEGNKIKELELQQRKYGVDPLDPKEWERND